MLYLFDFNGDHFLSLLGYLLPIGGSDKFGYSVDVSDNLIISVVGRYFRLTQNSMEPHTYSESI